MRFPRHSGIALALLLGVLCGCMAAMLGRSQAEPAQTPKVSVPKVSAPKVSAPKVDDRQLRIAIARMFENNRFILIPIFGAVRLHDSKIVGPRVGTTTSGKKFISYCVSTILDLPYGAFPKSAGVTVEKLQDGKMQIQMSIPRLTYQECTGPNIEPFPELERLRDARRRELGKTN